MAVEVPFELVGEATSYEVAEDTLGTYTPRTDLAEEAYAMLIPLFQQPRQLATLDATIAPWQYLEDVIAHLYGNLNVDDATGFLLDILGWRQDEPRNARSDDDYRLGLRVRSLVDRSSGTEPELFNIMTTATGGGTATMQQIAPKVLAAQIVAALPYEQQTALFSYLRQAKAAGEALFLTASPDVLGALDGDPLGGVLGAIDGNPLGMELATLHR